MIYILSDESKCNHKIVVREPSWRIPHLGAVYQDLFLRFLDENNLNEAFLGRAKKPQRSLTIIYLFIYSDI